MALRATPRSVTELFTVLYKQPGNERLHTTTCSATGPLRRYDSKEQAP